MAIKSMEDHVLTLMKIREKSLPFAAMNANNMLGQKMLVSWKREMKSTMTLRNRYTIGSLKLRKAKRPSLSSMKTIVGTRQPYVAKNESGGMAFPKKPTKHGMGWPTKAARGGGEKSMVLSKFKLNRKKIRKRGGGGRESQNAIQGYYAKKSKSYYALIETENRGFVFMQREGKGRDDKMNPLFGTKQRVKIDKNSMMERAFKATIKHDKEYFLLAIRREIRETLRRKGAIYRVMYNMG